MHYKKIAIVSAVVTLTIIGMAATNPPGQRARNLKVLPKDISHEDLGKIMDGWKTALGVKCGFCHAPSADSTSHRLDFASDAKPEKNIARHMYKMAAKINKKYFNFNKDDKGDVIPAITCVTCHRGSPHPDEVK
jgi:photosynthetic reaction center cytochrome c subunit